METQGLYSHPKMDIYWGTGFTVNLKLWPIPVAINGKTSIEFNGAVSGPW